MGSTPAALPETKGNVMKNLTIDIETYSSVSIGDAGSYKYAESEDFEILLWAYKVDEEPTKIIDLACGEKAPDWLISALKDPSITKHAYNAAFEWWCFNQAGFESPIDQWQCSMIHAMYCGFPAGLDATGKAIGLPEDKQKNKVGKELIKYFSIPCRPTKVNGGRTRNYPHHDMARWNLFKEYCIQDVEAEHEIDLRLKTQPVPEHVWTEWHHDIEINARGVHIDTEMLKGALTIDQISTEELIEASYRITGIENPKSNAQMLSWVQRNYSEDVENLQKATVEDLLEKDDLPDNVREALKLRQMINKTSVSKYEAMNRALGSGDRARGLLQFYGASRTGRWAGRLVQMQNLPRNYISTLDLARKLVRKHSYEGIRMLYGNVPDTLSQLIRTAFIPSDGNKFIVSDFSAIEARVIAWLAHEEWAMNVFATTGKIYEATAAQMFHVPEDTIVKGHENYGLRQKGKVATLALGYQGGSGALVNMGALKMGIPEEDLDDIKLRWREANPHIVDMWQAIEDAAIKCVSTGETTQPKLRVRDPERARYNEELCGRDPYSFSDYFIYPAPVNNIIFRFEQDLLYGLTYLTIQLPSGRKLYYNEPRIGINRFDKKAVHYTGINQTTKKWQADETYGGKLTENIVQAIARDCLAVTLERVIAAGYKPVMHIHDEIVIDATQDQRLEDVNAIFAEPIDWAPGLILKGAGFEADYYMKD